MVRNYKPRLLQPKRRGRRGLTEAWRTNLAAAYLEEAPVGWTTARIAQESGLDDRTVRRIRQNLDIYGQPFKPSL